MLLTKVIDVSDEAEPLPKWHEFSSSEPELDLGPDASAFDVSPISRMNRPQVAESPKSYDAELVGMAIKPRDPTVGMLIQNFIAKHGLRLVGFFPKSAPGRFLCDGYSDGLPRPSHRPLGVQNGLTRIPPRAAMTKEGKRWVTPYEEARLRRYNPVEGEAAYREQEALRNMAYEDRLSVQASGMSLADGNPRMVWDNATRAYRQVAPKSQKLPQEGQLPERHCQNPECLKEIGAKRHHNIKYCNDACTARAKELRRLHEIRQDGRPILYRNESDVFSDFTNDTSRLETGVISPHISRGIVPKDCPAEVAVYQQ
jgi:hypothetical protein